MAARARAVVRHSGKEGHPGSLVTVVVVLTILAGALVRVASGQVASGQLAELDATGPDSWGETGAASLHGAPPDRFPAKLSVEPGTTLVELIGEVDRIGLDSATFASLVNDPVWAGLEGTTWEAPTLERMLYPGDYVVATANPQELIAEMIDRLRVATVGEIEAEATTQGLTMTEVLERGSLVQALTPVPAEMPVAAEMLAAMEPDPVPVAPTIEAIRAVLWPTRLGTEHAARLGARFEGAATQLMPNAELRRTLDARTAPSGHGRVNELDRLLVPPFEPSGRIAAAVGDSSGMEAGHGSEALFETGGLEALAVAYVIEQMLVEQQLVPRRPVPVAPELLTLELPDRRDELRQLDVRRALDLVIDEGNQTALRALLDVVGPDEIQSRLRSVGVESTSLQSRPMVTTAVDTVLLAWLIDALPASGVGSGTDESAVGEEGTLFERFAAERGGSYMATDHANRSGFVGFSLRRPGVRHEIGRMLSGNRRRIVVHLGDNKEGSREAARHAASVVALYARHHEEHVGSDTGGCRFGPEADEVDGSSGQDEAVRRLRIGIDAAHGGGDRGDVHRFGDGTQLRESTVNLAVAMALRDRLVAAGVDVVMTRCGDVNVSLGERAHILNGSELDLALSINTDSHGLKGAIAGVDTPVDVTIESDDDPLGMLSIAPMVKIEMVSLSVPAEAKNLRAALDGDSDRIDQIVGAVMDDLDEATAVLVARPRADASGP
jgi:N-acetylmuramoyl-L-alanine amidase